MRNTSCLFPDRVARDGDFYNTLIGGLGSPAPDHLLLENKAAALL
jgi:hypothetical protein